MAWEAITLYWKSKNIQKAWDINKKIKLLAQELKDFNQDLINNIKSTDFEAKFKSLIENWKTIIDGIKEDTVENSDQILKKTQDLFKNIFDEWSKVISKLKKQKK